MKNKEYSAIDIIKIAIFVALYVIVGIVSMCHAVDFMCLTSVMWQGILLALAFELTQAYTLFHILTSAKNTFRAYFLMTLATIVQMTGNVFACYKFMKTDTDSALKYFAEIVQFFAEMINDEPMDERTCYITISMMIGILVPAFALLLTDMAVDTVKQADDETEEVPVEAIETHDTDELVEDTLNDEESLKNEKIKESKAVIEQPSPEETPKKKSVKRLIL